MLLAVNGRVTVTNLNNKIEAMQTEAVLLREELTASNSNLSQQQHENTVLRTENSALLDGHRRQMQVTLYTVSQKNDTDVAQYNFNAH